MLRAFSHTTLTLSQILALDAAYHTCEVDISVDEETESKVTGDGTGMKCRQMVFRIHAPDYFQI